VDHVIALQFALDKVVRTHVNSSLCCYGRRPYNLRVLQPTATKRAITMPGENGYFN
jgi:hypothetical protein